MTNRWNSSFKVKQPKPRKRVQNAPQRPTVRSRGLRKQRLDTIGKLKRDLWELCKLITRAKYRNKDGTFNCFTCGRLIDNDAKAQTGHFIPSSVGGALLRYELRQLRIQDYFCNINLGGNGSEFYKRLLAEIGQEEIDSLFTLKGISVKADRIWYANKISEYQELLKVL